MGDKFPFSLVVTGEQAIKPILQEELRRQRKLNRQLKQFSTVDKVTRLESKLLLQRLHAEGYYDAEVAFKVAGKQITYQVNSAALYRIKQVSLDLPKGISAPIALLNLSVGEPLKAQKVLTANTLLRDYIANNYCLLEIDNDYNVILETADKVANIRFSVEQSPAVNFGEIQFSGLKTIDNDYLLARLPIEKGECFKRSKLDAARVSLVKSNLLANVTATIGNAANAEVPITLNVKERRHRTLSAGLGFQTDDGFGINLGWANRNLQRRAQRLKIASQISQTQQNLTLDLTLPHYRRNNQSITFYSELRRENTEAFFSTATDLGAAISRPLWRQLRASLGAEVSFSKVEDSEQTESFALFSLPLRLEYDRRNDTLNPTRGWIAAGGLQPHWNAYQNTRFLKSSLAVSAYHSFAQQAWRPTIALRSAIGSIDGANREDVAANLRFYVGGGGSVRGYPFQTLGPLDESDAPLGGLSFSDYSAETRLRWGENWGGVLFLDGGVAYANSSPRVGEDLLWGAGIGLRYFTSFAPIRFDIAVPLNRRDSIDDPFQLYISIGQAF